MARRVRLLSVGPLFAALSWLGGPTNVHAQSPRVWRADFGDGWTQRWVPARLADRTNRVTVVQDGGERVLKIESDNSASALWYPLDGAATDEGRVAWRWRVDGALSGNGKEREKRGDDYAARFFVIFDGRPFSHRARAICYVWASSEPVGSAYRNPYFSNVATIVLQSGNDLSGQWIREERDFVHDYQTAFGKRPRRLSAVAVMVDTDNTERRATAWFADVVVESRASEERGLGPAHLRLGPRGLALSVIIGEAPLMIDR